MVGFRIVRADPQNNEHRQAIKQLWKDNLRFIAAGRFDWLYRDNPAGAPVTCLAVNEENDRVIGCASVMPRNFVIEGTFRRAGIAVDFAVDSKYRVFGPSLALQRKLTEEAWAEGMEFLIAFPNLASQGIFKRLGYKPIGSGIRYSRLIRSRDKLQKFVPSIFPRSLISLAGGVLDGLFMAGNFLKLKKSGSGSYSVEETGELKNLVQGVWKGNRTKKVLQGEHSSEFMQWRYEQCPYKRYRFFALSAGDGCIVAYLVFYTEEETVLIDDFRFSDERHLPVLIGYFWAYMRKRGAKALNIGLVSLGSAQQLLLRSGCIPRETVRWGGVLSTPGTPIDWHEQLQQGNWYITDGEIDL